MKVFQRLSLLVIWLVVATVLYAMVWTRHLDYFPQYPEWVGMTIEKITRPFVSPDDSESLTTIYILIVSFLNVTLITVLGYAIYRFWRKPDSSRR